MPNDLEADHSRIVNHVLAPPAGVFEIDPVHTFLGFSAQHLVVGKVRGHFSAVSGTVTIADDPSASTVEVSVETASITTMAPIRDDDIRSERYLDVKQYPAMVYRSTAVTEVPGGGWLVTGDLTLRNVTRPLELDVRFGGAVTDQFGNARLAFHASGSITRRDFGITSELLREAGGLLVGKDVAIDIDAEAIRPL
ncbi:MAG: YceI family protein [Streptosporangiaceae bacterium]|jgi:polyisoprenoid-binding protein YceI